MADYKKMHTTLYNGISDCIEALRSATRALIALQKKTEEIYMNGEAERITIADRKNQE